jgi:protoporphyrin/coproporphyrin ferrochelatase
MAHGTPASPDEIEAFYTRIRRGRPPTPELLADLRRRYEAIGGTSPLAARTAAQVAGINAALEAMAPGVYVVRYGAKHTDPSIEEAAAGLAVEGVEAVVGIVLTPHRASMGSDEYLDRAEAALAAAGGPPLVRVPQWYDADGFAPLLAARVLAAVDRLRGSGTPRVLFTAHSLPERVVAAGDPYPHQMADSAARVAEAAGLEVAGVPWGIAWQSAGRTPEPWIGPDLLAELRRLAAEGTTAAVVCPIGFVADHLEVLFDVDVEAQQVADEVGMALGRTESLNDDPAFTALLAEVVDRAAREANGAGGSVAGGSVAQGSVAEGSVAEGVDG